MLTVVCVTTGVYVLGDSTRRPPVGGVGLSVCRRRRVKRVCKWLEGVRRCFDGPKIANIRVYFLHRSRALKTYGPAYELQTFRILRCSLLNTEIMLLVTLLTVYQVALDSRRRSML